MELCIGSTMVGTWWYWVIIWGYRLIPDGTSIGPLCLYIFWNKWRFGRVSAIPDSQTLKDRATQLLRSRSGALITQLWLRGQSSLLASIWIWIQECRCPWEWLEVWWVAVKENHLSESFNPSTQSTELPSWTHRTTKKETCSVFVLWFSRENFPFSFSLTKRQYSGVIAILPSHWLSLSISGCAGPSWLNLRRAEFDLSKSRKYGNRISRFQFYEYISLSR